MKGVLCAVLSACDSHRTGKESRQCEANSNKSPYPVILLMCRVSMEPLLYQAGVDVVFYGHGEASV